MKELKQQLGSALLVILTVAAIVGAAINFQQQSRFHLPDDGVTWDDRPVAPGEMAVTALYVTPGGPGQSFGGIRAGDVLEAINGRRVHTSVEVMEILAGVGSWKGATYSIRRDGVEFTATINIGEATRDPSLYYQYAVGFTYLIIGLFVYFRRANAVRALHFFLLCLASFILFSFHYSGKLNSFDKVIYYGNVIAGYLAPMLFLHFACVFPEKQRWIARRGAALLPYVLGVALGTIHVGFAAGWLRSSAPALDVRILLDRIWLVFLCATYLAGGVVLAVQKRAADDAIVRRQLTWLRNGALLGMLPFTLIYAIPYVAGVVPNQAMRMAVLSLLLIPLTWAYAILRYRLMDVDVIFQEGYVYTLATLCVLGVFYGLLLSVSKAGELNGTVMLLMVLIAAFVFQPIRDWIQEQLDRNYFYKDRYDYRRTLIEFARELGATTDMDAMLETVADRLIRTLGVRHVAVFVLDEAEGKFQLQLASNRNGRQTENIPYGLDLSYLTVRPSGPYLFFERTRTLLDVVSHEWPTGVRRSIAELELTYYLPCAARGRTIAYLGVSRTESGDFLSSEDVELLVTLSGYVGIAVENANLFRSLASKADEYERLKEYSENIVESINVGILAVDLEDRVESWNSQIEKMTGVPRQDALGRALREVLPVSLCDQLESGRSASSVQNIYRFKLREREATMNVAIEPLLSKDGQRIGRLIILDDITDRTELERRLVQADKLSSIGLLAAGVAHEVNTPLAVISTYAQMLAKQISGDERTAPLLEKIKRQTFRASEIVNSLLNFSRTSPTEFVSIDANKILQETLTLMEHQLAQAGVEVQSNFAETLPRIRGNSGKLQQVFLNLVLNARDAMEGGGRLEVATSSQDSLVRVLVRDSGSGIAPENLPRIFDPFFTTKGAKRGTGLGLSVSYGIVREHGGDIEVSSEPGRGTRFTLLFPVAGSPAIAPEAAAQVSGPASGKLEPSIVVERPRQEAAPISAVSGSTISAQPAVPAVHTAQSDRMIQ
jgi:hypothetical protein